MMVKEWYKDSRCSGALISWTTSNSNLFLSCNFLNMRIFRISTALLAAAGLSSAFPTSQFATRQDTPGIPGLPTEITDYKTIKTKRGPTIRYKEPGKAGVCETTPGVNSYAGYIDLDEKNHIYFWFQESRKDPANDDLTLCKSIPPAIPCMLQS